MSSEYAYSPLKTKYRIVLKRWDKIEQPDVDVIPITESATWSDEEGEATSRLTLTFVNKYLKNVGCFTEELFLNGEVLELYADEKLINKYEIKSVDTDYSTSAYTHSVTAYDRLHYLSKNKESVYYPKGKGTKEILTDIFKRGGMELDYDYVETTHEEILTKNQSMLNTISDVLNKAYIDKGDFKPIVINYGDKVKITNRDWQENIYVFYRYEPAGDYGNVIDFNRTASIESLVTRVTMKGTQKEDKTYEEYGTIDGHTEYDVINEDLFAEGEKTKWDIKREALKIIQEQGEQELSYSIQVPDIPHVRKGHKIRLEITSYNRGYFFILSASHDIGSRTMNLKIVPEDYEHKTDTTLSDEELKEEQEYLAKKKAEEEAKKAAEAANNKSGTSTGSALASGDKAAAIIAKAREYLGYHEGANNYSIFGARYGQPNSAWCAWFVRACAEDVGLPFPNSGYVPTIKSWAQQTGRWSSTGGPGYYAVFNGASHIEICIEDLGGGRIHSIGGNYSDKVDEHTRGGVSGYINPFI